jgi:hypothetical protein
MTQPYSFTHTADTWHAKASAAKRLCSNALVLIEPINSRVISQPESSRRQTHLLLSQ